MPDKNQAVKDKEREAQLKALREELTREIEQQLPAELVEGAKTSKTSSYSMEVTNEEDGKRIIEAILFTASKPVTVSDFKRVLPQFGASQIQTMIHELKIQYESMGHSFRIQEIANGFECSTEPKYAPWIMKLELQRKAKQATQSALESLAILAYKQPITRAEIEELRGVDVSGVLSTLMDRNLIKIVGRKEVPGRPFLYGTTEKFLEHFGLKSLTDLPDISELKTLVENSIKKDDLLKTNQTIAVNPEGTVDAPSDENNGQVADETVTDQNSEGNVQETTEPSTEEILESNMKASFEAIEKITELDPSVFDQIKEIKNNPDEEKKDVSQNETQE